MEEFSFKYVSEDELNEVVNQVHREKKKENFEKEWAEFINVKTKLVSENLSEKDYCSYEHCLEENHLTETCDVESYLSKESVKNSLTDSVINEFLTDSNNHSCCDIVGGSINLEPWLSQSDELNVCDCPNLSDNYLESQLVDNIDIIHDDGKEYRRCFKENDNRHKDDIESFLLNRKEGRETDCENCSNCQSKQLNRKGLGKNSRIKLSDSTNPNYETSEVSKTLKSLQVSSTSVLSRIENTKKKIIFTLNKLLESCWKNIEVEDDDVIERRLKKVKEFLARFSRNYLYQLRREVETLKKSSFNSNPSFSNIQKLYPPYQTSLQAYQAFLNILPDRFNLHSEKFIEFQDLFFELLDYSEVPLKDAKLNIEIKELSTKLAEIFKKNAKLAVKPVESDKNKSTKIDVPCTDKKKNVTKQKLPKKLSMYCSTRVSSVNPDSKKTLVDFNRKKLGLPNKNENANNKKAVLENSTKIPKVTDTIEVTDEKQSNGGNSVTSLKTKTNKLSNSNNLTILPPIDEVSTVIENCLVDGSETDNFELFEDCKEKHSIGLLIEKMGKNLLENPNIENGCKPKSDNENEEKKNKSKKLTITEEEMNNVLHQICEVYLNTEGSNHLNDSLSDHSRLRRCVSGGGEPLVKENKRIENKVNCDKKNKNVCFTEMKFNEEDFKKKVKCKTPCIKLEINDQQLQSVLDYRNKFVNHTKNSSIYDAIDHRWNLVKRLGDSLLSKILSDVSKEIEINVLLQKMFDLEFKQG